MVIEKLKNKNLVIIGKRKSAVAKATIKQGSGKIEISINKKPIEFFPDLQQLELQEPIIIAKEIFESSPDKLNLKIDVNVKGGGIASRVAASRLAIARAIVEFTKSDKLKKAYLAYDRHLIIADTRRKEACKPGDSKARARRQTSYR